MNAPMIKRCKLELTGSDDVVATGDVHASNDGQYGRADHPSAPDVR